MSLKSKVKHGIGGFLVLNALLNVGQSFRYGIKVADADQRISEITYEIEEL